MEQTLEALIDYRDFIANAYIVEGQFHWLEGTGDAIKALEEALKQEQDEPVAFKIYLPKAPRQDVNHGLLPWVYDQDPSSGNVASMWVTPVQTLKSNT